VQYLYHPNCGESSVELKDSSYRHVCKVRRIKKGQEILLRNLRDQYLYRYRVTETGRQSIRLELHSRYEKRIAPVRLLHIGWCIIDPKKIEKSLPGLNEIGVDKITFIRCSYTQGNFSLDMRRLERILLNSSQQCGRSVMMTLEKEESIESFLGKHPESMILDFSEKKLDCHKQSIETLLVGCEGGWSEKEKSFFSPDKIIGLDTPLILRSETAVCAAASRLIL
jgi:16S rRNA (uracil1498-N3)-methyltransferase